MSLLNSRFSAVITQVDWDNKLVASTKLLIDLDVGADDKLAAIEENAKADQTGAEIKAAYEAETNAYTDTKDTKLAGIEESADANVGEEFTTAEQAKVAKLGANNIPIEVFDDIPASPVEGDIYYDVAPKQFLRYNGTSWEAVEFVVEIVT